MGGVDRTDQMAATCRSVRKYIKWYKKLFFYIFDMCIINSFVLSKVVGGKYDLTSFKLKLVEEMVSSSTLPIYSGRGRPYSLPNPERLVGRHFPEKIPATDTRSKPQKRCKLCHLKSIRKETIYQCKLCSVPLCVVPCFEEFHVKKNL
jgi:hypothetical protein